MCELSPRRLAYTEPATPGHTCCFAKQPQLLAACDLLLRGSSSLQRGEERVDFIRHDCSVLHLCLCTGGLNAEGGPHSARSDGELGPVAGGSAHSSRILLLWSGQEPVPGVETQELLAGTGCKARGGG